MSVLADQRQTTRDLAEADVFAVELDAVQCWSVGVVSRTSARWPHLILVHFFPYLSPQRPVIERLPTLEAPDAVFVCRMSDLALRSGDWPVIGRLREWSTQSWPMPRFIVPAYGPGGGSREEIYYEHDPGHLKRSTILSDPIANCTRRDGAAFGPALAAERLIEALQSADPPAVDHEPKIPTNLAA